MSMFDHIKKPIQEAYPEALVYVRDPRRDGIHIEVLVITDAFAGKSLVAQHKLIMHLFQDAFQKDVLHALGVKTFTTEQWNSKKDQFTNLF